MERSGLRVIPGRSVAGLEPAVGVDPAAFQAACVEAYVASWTARGFSPVTIENDSGVLERVLVLLGRPAWEVTVEDMDRAVGALAADGLACSTRRGYVQAFKGFHRFLQARKAVEIQALFGVRLVSPVDEFNASRHIGDESPALLAPPTPERVSEFFAFLRSRIATARKYAPAARDYAFFRTLYHAGLRADEAAQLERADVHFGRGPFGKLHVRFGKAAHTSGPRPRWVPMLDGLDLVLAWYLNDVRDRFPDSPVLFCDESGGDLHQPRQGSSVSSHGALSRSIRCRTRCPRRPVEGLLHGSRRLEANRGSFPRRETRHQLWTGVEHERLSGRDHQRQ